MSIIDPSLRKLSGSSTTAKQFTDPFPPQLPLQGQLDSQSSRIPGSLFLLSSSCHSQGLPWVSSLSSASPALLSLAQVKLVPKPGFVLPNWSSSPAEQLWESLKLEWFGRAAETAEQAKSPEMWKGQTEPWDILY